MSREIDCPVCENTGVLLDGDTCGHCKGTGLIKLYTEEELQEAIDRTKEGCALICEDQVEDENDMISLNYKCAEAIRDKSVYTKMDKDFQMNDESIDMIKNGGWEEELK